MILTTLHLCIALIVVVAISTTVNVALSNRNRATVRHEAGCLATKIWQLHERINALAQADDKTKAHAECKREEAEKTQLQIAVVVTETLAIITNEAGHKALAKSAADELAAFMSIQAQFKQESIHTHEAYH